MTSHDVPFISQYEGIADPAWQWRGCGIVALKMVMDYWHGRSSRNRTSDMRELLEAGRTAGAYREGIGWSHGGLVETAKRYGYSGYNEDFAQQGPTPKTPEEAWTELKHHLARGPVLVSVTAQLDPERGGGHLVVVTGYNDECVSLCDPKEMNERDGQKILAKDRFLRAFKLRYIVLEPKASA